jgi:ribulose-phosphate 3-epimerase
VFTRRLAGISIAALTTIKSFNVMAGVAINPHTPISHLSEILHKIDLVCVMSVNPGFGGQRFIPYTLEKISALRALINQKGLSTKIEVDGGSNRR